MSQDRVSQEEIGDFLSPAEFSHCLEERDSMIGQLQRSKAAIIQSHEDLKKLQEEDSKVTHIWMKTR